MTDSADTAPVAGVDDWDSHWDAYGDTAEGNPSNIYRRDLILRLLGDLRPGAILLDIGSGQGEFALELARTRPSVQVWGVEYSRTGVERAQKASDAEGLGARFIQRDLLQPVSLDPGQPAAGYAICSEVLEHVEDPATLLRNATSLLAPGAKIVLTVPGGPRSAFDLHIGHRQHFTAASFRRVLLDAGLDVDVVLRSGFPGFNLYKLAVVSRGKKLIADLESRGQGAPVSKLESVATRVFSALYKINRDDARFGWQIVAVAHVPAAT